MFGSSSRSPFIEFQPFVYSAFCLLFAMFFHFGNSRQTCQHIRTEYSIWIGSISGNVKFNNQHTRARTYTYHNHHLSTFRTLRIRTCLFSIFQCFRFNFHRTMHDVTFYSNQSFRCVCCVHNALPEKWTITTATLQKGWDSSTSHTCNNICSLLTNNFKQFENETSEHSLTKS